ncbi:MAG: GIY-YIG nuclease family protein [Acidobacteriota bacterium]|nr:GIY-YIG nuclease family protein [Acidobacteriota bacterium]
MPEEHHYYVYILSSRSRTLYVGVTNKLLRRVEEHRDGTFDGFTSKYRIHRLVYFEHFKYIGNAIAREKAIKGWLRIKKVALIEAENPTWEDLYVDLVAGR